MRTFNYSVIREHKWDSEILGLVAAIYKEAGKQELYPKQRPEELEKVVEIAKVQSTEDVVLFVKYLLGSILSAYKDFEDCFALVETKLPAVETVRRATMEKIGRFTKKDIRELCPSFSISSIEGRCGN